MLEWCICVELHFGRGVNIVQFELLDEAVGAADHVVSVSLRSSRHVSDAVPADVVRTAGGDKDCIEIPKANRAVILELFLKAFFSRIEIDTFYILLIDLGLDSDLVSCPNLSKLLFGPLNVVKLLVESGKLVIIVDF